MKLNIQRPSTFIRYTDSELTPEQREYYLKFKEFCKEHRGQVLEGAAPIWGSAWERTAERIIKEENDAAD